MVGDVHRAVAWIKTNAQRYGVDPGRVVVMGGSSGAHIALLRVAARPGRGPDRGRLALCVPVKGDTTGRAPEASYPGTSSARNNGGGEE
jgi:acetyl esterase/lipase